jgi:MoaA/NifB/PqqE/SkfB family radical SAM enzyme
VHGGPIRERFPQKTKEAKMEMEKIGFYTLSDERCRNLSETSRMMRCEMILTDRCNFRCTYCRGLKPLASGDIRMEDAEACIREWAKDGLRAIRFSGGEPTAYAGLPALVALSKRLGVEWIAISTNGSARRELYQELVDLGANDFSVSLDACCAETTDRMSGVRGKFETVTENIRFLSTISYVTVGVVLNEDNIQEMVRTVRLAHSLGVADIRLIPSAQTGRELDVAEDIGEEILNAHPILRFRVGEAKKGHTVRGLDESSSDRCYLPIDDSVVANGHHYPCVIYLREGGDPIGKVGPDMRRDRIEWSRKSNPKGDPICSRNCLDVCEMHNRKCRKEGK